MSCTGGERLHVEIRARRGHGAGASALVDELADALAAGFPPALDLAVVGRAGTLVRAWGGCACTLEPGVAATSRTLYDLASLTKVVATTTLALRLADEGSWRLEDALASHLPEFTRGDVTLAHLLTHTSGIVAHVPFFLTLDGAAAVRRAVLEEGARGSDPGGVLYSDLNYMLLGWAVESVAGERLDRLFRDLVARPLGMSRTRFRPPARERARAAATELDGDQRRTPGLVWGEVHDGNAHALGGIAGHAGLFAPCEDLARFVSALLDPQHHPVLAPETIASMGRAHAGTAPEVRGLGWRVDPAAWGDWPATAYWHTGFTGTSLLVSPDTGVGIALLTNAIHPVRALERQAALRERVHRAVARFVA